MAPGLALTLLLALQRLHVLSFSLDASTAAPNVEQPFDVTITVRTAEPLQQMTNLFLPSLDGAEEIGDEHALTSAPGGSTYRETLRVVAHASGPLDITPAYLDAIDARDGKPKRFISNPLHVTVAGPLAPQGPDAGTILWVWIYAVAFLSGLTVLGFILVRGAQKPQVAPSAAAPAPYVPPPEPVPTPDAQLQAAVQRLREERTRANVLRVRDALWRMIGAPEGATLRDVLTIPATADPRTRQMLQRVERAAFVEESHLQDAITEIVG